TGVSRPKMDTSTLSFWLSALISEIVAGNVSNGPSVTVTDSPTEKSTCTGGAPGAGAPACGAGAFSSMVGASIETTSSWVSGTGEWARPTNPVTPGVWRTAPQDSSVRSMRTST